MSVDLRSRVDGPPAALDVADLFGHVLPDAFAASAEQLAPAAAARAPRPLTVAVAGRAWTLSVAGGRPAVAPATPGATPVLHLDADQLRDLVDDQSTPVAWLAGGTLRLDGGGLPDVLDWWLLLRGALDGTAPHVPGAVTLTDRDGGPLDLGRRFTPDDPADEMAHFLHQAGFLHLTGLYGEDEMAAVAADMDAAAPRYRPGDGRSWWATLADGRPALVRMQGFDAESPATARLLADARIRRLGTLTGDDHHLPAGPNRIEALFKPLAVRQGISDVPWHKDCSLGRHSYDCCSLTVGLSVTGADARSGQLRVVAGSHRALIWPAPSLQPGLDLPVVDLPTRTGDVTLHLSCTLHMAQPPVDRERRVLYTSLVMAPLAPEDAHRARTRLGAVREAAPLTLSQPAAG